MAVARKKNEADDEPDDDHEDGDNCEAPVASSKVGVDEATVHGRKFVGITSVPVLSSKEECPCSLKYCNIKI